MKKSMKMIALYNNDSKALYNNDSMAVIGK